MSSSAKPTLPLAHSSTGARPEPPKARRSTKTAHKLKVLPEQPIPPTQSTVGSDAEDNPDDDPTALTDDDPPESAPETTAVDPEEDAEVGAV
jgi:hypothetical protein